MHGLCYLDASTVIFQQDEWLPPKKKNMIRSSIQPEKHEGVWVSPSVPRVARKDCLMYVADRSRCHNSLLANDISIAKMTLTTLIVLAVHTQSDMYLQAIFTWVTESIAPIIVPHPCLPRLFFMVQERHAIIWIFICSRMDLRFVSPW